MPFILILGAILGVIPGAIAARKGRSFVLWWLFGSLLFIVALPMSIILKPARQCPECAGGVDKKARKCRHCGSPLPA